MACCQTITQTHAELLIGPSRNKHFEIWFKIHKFTFSKKQMKMPLAIWGIFCGGHNVLYHNWIEGKNEALNM